jgi:glycosyltransferase involved in cell wall biosynthesis
MSKSGTGDQTNLSLPRLLYFCDFPPSNLRGGTVTMSRLLADFTADDLTILTGSYFNRISPSDGRIACRHVIFPSTDETGRFGLGRLKSLLNWLLIPALCAVAAWVIKRERIDGILTIAHGYFFIAACLTSIITATPYILIVHDDWVPPIQSSSYILKFGARPLFKFVARHATHIYCVSPPMQEMLKSEYGVDSDLQMPAAEPRTIDSVPARMHEESIEDDDKTLRIFYAGTTTGATADSLELLINLVKSDKLASYNLPYWELHLYMLITAEQVRELGWDHERIKVHGWVDQETLYAAITTADILFLPFSFREDQKFATVNAFPSKTSDYLASERPILILAPSYSSVVRYARQYGFAEIVDELNEDALARGIFNICSSSERRAKLAAQGKAVFNQNHNVVNQRASFRKLLASIAKRGTKDISADVITSV